MKLNMSKQNAIGGTLVFALAAGAAHAGQELHKAPYDFLMGNHIDDHMENKMQNDGSLKGRLYVYFTGEIDSASGLPIARHPRGESHNEVCGVDPIDCVVGWDVRAVPADAVFVSHSGVNGNDHPIWLIPSRNDIPQPGSYTHFHWITSTSSDYRAASVWDTVCDVQKAAQLEGEVVAGTLQLNGGADGEWSGADVHAGGGAENISCPGWLLEITAKRKFAFDHGGEKVAVTNGVDNSTHLNIVTNYAIVPAISGSGGGGH